MICYQDHIPSSTSAGNSHVPRWSAPIPTLNQILPLAERGLRLFPCKPRSKKPSIKAWPRLASSDPLVLARWAKQFPGCNWAVATGWQSTFLFVFVFDVDKEGWDTLAALEREHGPVPVTLTDLTGDDGEHRYFLSPVEVRNSTDKLGTGLHIRGKGGLAIVPPSIHPLGQRYRWVDESVPIAAAPDWLLELITKPTPADRRSPVDGAPSADASHAGNGTDPKRNGPRTSGSRDFKYIRKHVPIIDVACALGIRLSVTNAGKAHCWRTQNHDHDDDDPSLTFWENKVKCWRCDENERPYSNIDLVQKYLGCEAREAAQWIAERFNVPASKDSHTSSSRVHASADNNVMALLIRTGMCTELTPLECLLLSLFAAFADPHTGMTTISYPGLMHYSNIKSRATVSQAIRHLEQLGALQVFRKRDKSFFRRVNQYRPTIDNPKFQSLVASVSQRHQAEIPLEKAFAAEKKRRRKTYSSVQ